MTQHNSPSSSLLRINDACARLGVKRSKLYQLMGSGQLRFVKIGNRRLVPEGAIGEFIAALEAETSAA